MFVVNMLLAITGILILILVLILFIYKLSRTKKNLYSWFILIITIFFLTLAVCQSLRLLNIEI